MPIGCEGSPEIPLLELGLLLKDLLAQLLRLGLTVPPSSQFSEFLYGGVASYWFNFRPFILMHASTGIMKKGSSEYITQ
jgi:hypothetical protein